MDPDPVGSGTVFLETDPDQVSDMIIRTRKSAEFVQIFLQNDPVRL